MGCSTSVLGREAGCRYSAPHSFANFGFWSDNDMFPIKLTLKVVEWLYHNAHSSKGKSKRHNTTEQSLSLSTNGYSIIYTTERTGKILRNIETSRRSSVTVEKTEDDIESSTDFKLDIIDSHEELVLIYRLITKMNLSEAKDLQVITAEPQTEGLLIRAKALLIHNRKSVNAYLMWYSFVREVKIESIESAMPVPLSREKIRRLISVFNKLPVTEFGAVTKISIAHMITKECAEADSSISFDAVSQFFPFPENFTLTAEEFVLFGYNICISTDESLCTALFDHLKTVWTTGWCLAGEHAIDIQVVKQHRLLLRYANSTENASFLRRLERHHTIRENTWTAGKLLSIGNFIILEEFLKITHHQSVLQALRVLRHWFQRLIGISYCQEIRQKATSKLHTLESRTTLAARQFEHDTILSKAPKDNNGLRVVPISSLTRHQSPPQRSSIQVERPRSLSTNSRGSLRSNNSQQTGKIVPAGHSEMNQTML